MQTDVTNKSFSLQSTVTKTFLVQDVTENKLLLKEAFTIVAENYALLSSHDVSPEMAYLELCTDSFHQAGISRTLLITGHNPIKKINTPLATARVIVNQDNSVLPALEAMELVHPTNGWKSFNFMNFMPELSAEIGRFVVIPECRQSKIGNTSMVTLLLEQLFWRFVEIAHAHGKEQMWAIMPKYTVKIVESFGVRCIPIPNMHLNYKEHTNLFQKYDRYWLRSNPWFYRYDI